MSLPFTAQDVLFAAILALVFTWLINKVSGFFRAVVNHAAEFSYLPHNLESVQKRCYLLFPNEHVRINGDVFRRGMRVRVVTIQRKIIEGKLIGCNDENMVCVMTDSSVVAQELENIEAMSLVEG